MPVKVKVKVEDKSEYIQIPAIALRGLVLFPDNLVSFDVGREKSIKAVETAMKGDRLIYLVPQMDFEIEDPKAEDLYQVGVVAEVRQILKLHDNVIKVLVETQYRAKTKEIADDGYLQAVVEKYPESEEAGEYSKLASNIMDNENISIPEPMDDEEFEEFFKSFI